MIYLIANVNIKKNVLLALFVLSLLGCYEKRDLHIDEQYKKWNENENKNYEIEYILHCFCEQNNLLQKSIIRNAIPIDENKLSVDKLFGLIMELPDEHQLIEVRYDKKKGYPKFLHIDRQDSMDSSITIEIVSLNNL